MTNEERFIASCQSLGEADVRQKLNAARFSGRRADWASTWLGQLESAKSDDIKAEENTGLLTARPNRHVAAVVSALVLVSLVAGVAMFLTFK
jgi:hypothetical protein